jgi:hypothetical protein
MLLLRLEELNNLSADVKHRKPSSSFNNMRVRVESVILISNSGYEGMSSIF